MFTDLRERERERERETSMQAKNIEQLLPVCALTRDGTHNLGMCPDRELNPQPVVHWMRFNH